MASKEEIERGIAVQMLKGGVIELRVIALQHYTFAFTEPQRAGYH